MLLNNLNVSNGCKVSFDSEVETAPPSPEALRETVFRVAGDEGGLNSSVEDGGVGEDGIGGGSSPGSETAVDPLKEVDVAVGEKDKGEEWMVDISGLRSDLFALCSDLTVSREREQQVFGGACLGSRLVDTAVDGLNIDNGVGFRSCVERCRSPCRLVQP